MLGFGAVVGWGWGFVFPKTKRLLQEEVVALLKLQKELVRQLLLLK